MYWTILKTLNPSKINRSIIIAHWNTKSCNIFQWTKLDMFFFGGRDIFLHGIFSWFDFVLWDFVFWDFVFMGFFPLGFFPHGIFSYMGFCPHGIFSYMGFCPHGILSGYRFTASIDFLNQEHVLQTSILLSSIVKYGAFTVCSTGQHLNSMERAMIYKGIIYSQ